ncbi:MAG: hypothetical protein JKY65_25980 [Planctomycetes bacterium]|nr:hypothetical protein [Planctomycetota bacterium]
MSKSRKLTVEQVPVRLDLADLAPSLRRGQRSWSSTWVDQDHELHARLDLAFVDDEARVVVTTPDAKITQVIELDFTQSRFGSRRWWLCPACGRRARILYLLPRQETLRDRTCAGLSYRSRQRSGSKIWKAVGAPHARLEAARVRAQRWPLSRKRRAAVTRAEGEFLDAVSGLEADRLVL